MWTFKELTDRLYGPSKPLRESELTLDQADDTAGRDLPAYNSGRDYGALGVAVPKLTVH